MTERLTTIFSHKELFLIYIMCSFVKPQIFCNMFDDFAHAAIGKLRTGDLNDISTFKCQKLKRTAPPYFNPRLDIFNNIKC